jgi:hypothetical protein
MLLKQVVPVTFSFIVLCIGVIIVNEHNLQIESEFSINLKKWFNRGKYFDYNGHKIFYVYEKLEKDTLLKPAIVFLHGFPTSSYDYTRIWDQFMTTSTDLNQLEIETKANSLLAFDYLGQFIKH